MYIRMKIMKPIKNEGPGTMPLYDVFQIEESREKPWMVQQLRLQVADQGQESGDSHTIVRLGKSTRLLIYFFVLVEICCKYTVHAVVSNSYL